MLYSRDYIEYQIDTISKVNCLSNVWLEAIVKLFMKLLFVVNTFTKWVFHFMDVHRLLLKCGLLILLDFQCATITLFVLAQYRI